MLVLDGGGNADNGDAIGLETARALAEALGRIGVDAVALGEEEASFGKEFLAATLLGDPRLAVLSANVIDSGSGARLLPSVKIVDVAGVRVGITAVARAELEPGFVKTRQPGLVASDPVAAAKTAVGALVGHVDLVIVLAHLGSEPARALGRELAGATPVLVLASGAAHAERPWGPQAVAPGVLVHAAGVGELGQWLGVYELEFRDGRLAGVTGRGEELLEGVVPDDPELAQVVEAYNAGLARYVVQDPTESERLLAELHGDGPRHLGSGRCFPCHDGILGHYLETPHGHAYKPLERTPSRRNNPRCLPCHTTFFNLTAGDPPRGVYAEPGVGCEACHGPAGDHPANPTDPDARRGFRPVTTEVCQRCHNAEQTPGFDMASFWERIKHPR